MDDEFEKFWANEFIGIIKSGQPEALIMAWKEVAHKSFLAGTGAERERILGITNQHMRAKGATDKIIASINYFILE